MRLRVNKSLLKPHTVFSSVFEHMISGGPHLHNGNLYGQPTQGDETPIHSVLLPSTAIKIHIR